MTLFRTARMLGVGILSLGLTQCLVMEPLPMGQAYPGNPPSGENLGRASVAKLTVLGLAERINAEMRALVPNDATRLDAFDRYQNEGGSLWARGWRGRIDVSGVSWDQTRTCTLISPRHVFMAAHYQRNPGDTIIFQDRSGRPVVTMLEAKLAVPGNTTPDIAVGLLAQPVPIRYYRVLPPRDDYPARLLGALVIATDKDRNLLVREIGGLSNRRVSYRPALGYNNVFSQPLIVGDSGNPSFLMINGEPILIATHTFGGMGSGPFFGFPENYQAINELMAQLGGGYQLTPIQLDD